MATPLPNPLAAAKQGSKWGIVWEVLLLILGTLAIGEPLLAAIALTTFIAWLAIFVVLSMSYSHYRRTAALA